jgi:hypothetical protein
MVWGCHISIKKLSALGIGLGVTKTQRKITINTNKDMCETRVAKNESNGSLSSYRHFTKYLVGVN